MSMKPMFDLDALPEKPDTPAKRWYISVLHKNVEFVLVATHSDGTMDWRKAGTFKHQPHLYRTIAGAQRQAAEYVKPETAVTIKEWKGW